MALITPEMTILEVLSQYRGTEAVFRSYDEAAGVCLCCRALFDPLEETARKYGLDLEGLLAELEQAAASAPDASNQQAAPEE